ncbi:MAG: hypothetical protein JWM47_4077, partial [Acidimicrobiales bacterium]|nr:hypothetical protein [Acidimicrobiales bacterium]
LAHYRQELEDVRFLSTIYNPTNTGLATSRTITSQLDDGSGAGNHNLSSPVNSEIFLHTIDLDGSNAGTGFAVTYTEHGSPAPVADVDVLISDSDIGNMKSATITLNNAQATDLLSVSGLTGGITTSSYVYDSVSGTGVLTLSGVASTADYKSALHHVVFSSSSGNIDTTNRDVAVSVTDNLDIVTNTAHATISIVAVNDAPILDGHGGSLSYTENNAPTAIDPLLTLTDADSANINSATVRITGNFHTGEDLLGFTTHNGISASYDGSTGVLTLTGASSVANYETALRSVTYFNSSDNPSAQTRTISFQAVDDSGTASSVSTATVSVTPVNDAPVMAGLNANTGFIENGVAVGLSSALVVSDADSTQLTGARVAIGGFVAGDTLDVVTTGTAITSSYDAATGVLTLSGLDSAVDYQHVLASITFASSSDNPSNFGTQPTRSITWSLTDLDQTSPAHANATGTEATTIAITAINDAPVATAGNILNFNANAGQPITIDAGISVHDVDSLTLSGASVTIAGGFEAANDGLGFVNQNGITGSYNSATGVLTLGGTASVADYQAALASVSFSSITQSNGTRIIQWAVNDGSAQFNLSPLSASTLNVSGIIIPPHVFSDNSFTAPIPASLLAGNGLSGSLGSGLGAGLFGNGGDGAGGAGFGAGLFGNGSSGTGFHVVHADAVLTTASDATVQIQLALASLEAPLGGEVAYVVARQANGDPLPDWLKFDPATGTFVGLPPDGAVASIEPDQSLDDNLATASVSPRENLGAGPSAPAPKTITVEVLARDSKGNVAVTIFTIDLRPRNFGKQGWNTDWTIQRFADVRDGRHPTVSAELAAIEAAVRDATRPFEPFGSDEKPARHGSEVSIGFDVPPPAGRAGLSAQMAGIGWRSIEAQRNALLASLQQGR